MHRHIRPLGPLVALAVLGAAACTERPTAPAREAPGTPVPTPAAAASPAERLARSLAIGLRSPVLRAFLRAQFRLSPFPEGKLQFQRFLGAADGHALRAVAGAARVSPADLATLARTAIPLELYLPVPAHRAAWLGGGRVLVATALADGDPPVAFDTAGTRYLLDPDTPPRSPVLALVPVETDFTAPPNAMMCYERCSGGGGGGGGSWSYQTNATPGLYLTQTHFGQTFEGWLKGSPEFEVHILGQKDQSDSLTDYQCIGEHQPAPYYFDQNTLDWAGSVLLFSQAQLDQYHTAHPNQNVRVFVVEDDDTACQIKTDAPDVFAVVDSLNRWRTAGTDTTTVTGKAFNPATPLQRLLALAASLINTNDELVGNAVADSVAGEYHSGFNWIVRDAVNRTNGWITLEMR
jgi:hypothetical protein